MILGGPESANHPAEYLGAGADVIVVGEGETTLTDLMATLPSMGPHDLDSVRGIVFKNPAGELVHTPERGKINDLDTLPMPDREAIDHQKYLDAWRTHHGASSSNLITARGCPYRCTWCSHAVYGYSHRRRSPENVAAEVAWIAERYNPDQVWYADDVFTISHPWLQKYKAALEARGLHLPFEDDHARRPPSIGRRRRGTAGTRLLSSLDRLRKRQSEDTGRDCSAVSASNRSAVPSNSRKSTGSASACS